MFIRPIRSYLARNQSTIVYILLDAFVMLTKALDVGTNLMKDILGVFFLVIHMAKRVRRYMILNVKNTLSLAVLYSTKTFFHLSHGWMKHLCCPIVLPRLS